ncbi:histidine triad nucleotide-binding protein [Candidatus Shapirobacteria bacterium]|nr:histidine triad nucleotide-binding protein [Candidatus Shapirobacteria bacterium]
MVECIFCKIIKGEIPTEFLYQDEEMVAFRDINPKAPVHILIVPKKHIEKLQEVGDNEKDLMGELLLAAKKIAKREGIDKTGYQVCLNCGEGAGQVIPHLHLHLLGGWKSQERGCAC